MAKAVQGYLSEDNVYFDTAEDCELYEAEDALRRVLDKMEIDDDKFIGYITTPTLRLGIERYFNALNYFKVSFDQSDIAKANETAPAQQQPPRSDEPVSDMGRRTQSKGVR